MAPLASDAIGAGQYALMNHDASADAGTENDSENHLRTPPSAINRFREGKTVGVIGQPYLAPQPRLQLSLIHI